MFAGFVLLSPPKFLLLRKKKTPCISVSTFSGTKRNRRRHILLCLNWIWGGFSTSQTVVDFSHLCRAPCCLHNPGHYGFVKKSPQFGAVRLFFLFFFSQDGKKTTVDLLISFFFFYLEENSANVPWSGWDEEITKQTGGFYKRPKSCSQEPKGKKKKSRKLQQRPGEKKKTWASFKNHKKSDN